MRKQAVSVLIGLAAVTLPFLASAQVPVGAPPLAAPSSYYVLPGQTLTFSGYHFAPGETVTIASPSGMIATVVANTTGSFAGAGAYVVPFSYEKSTEIFSVGGIPLRIVVGGFYPNLAPSSYYVAPGAEMGATASGFAPGEEIALYINGVFVVEGAANSGGNLYFYFPAPTSGSNFTLEADGLSSDTHSVRTITSW